MRHGIIFDIQRFSIHDGPGIRTTIFFKGCPLRCVWCANPESQHFQPELMWNKQEKSNSLAGESMKVSDIMDIIIKDLAYYEQSDGGVTFSGGEVLSQYKFAIELAVACHKQGIHVACESSAWAPQEIFKKLVEVLDLIILDVKHYDTEKHKNFTGVELGPILRNVYYAILSGRKVLIRIPVIPLFNDSLHDAEQFVLLFKEYGITEVELLPFHQFGKSKYQALNREYFYNKNQPLKKMDLLEYQEIFLRNKINCRLE